MFILHLLHSIMNKKLIHWNGSEELDEKKNTYKLCIINNGCC